MTFVNDIAKISKMRKILDSIVFNGEFVFAFDQPKTRIHGSRNKSTFV